MVQGGVLGTVVDQVLVSWCPVVAEVFLGVAASDIFEADEEEGVGYLESLVCAFRGGADTLVEAAEFVVV